MDLSDTIAPKSDQVDADDLIPGPRTVTVTGIKAGSVEQPVQIELAEFPKRPYRPSKSMRRVLVQCWGSDGAQYVGRRMTLFRDPTIKFGGIAVGGIRISHLSHIDKPSIVPLTVMRGKKEMYKVQPLPDEPAAPAAPTMTQISQCTDLDQLRTWWQQADPRHRDLIKARVDDLQKPAEVVDEQTGEVQDAFPEPAAPAAGADPWAEGGAK